MVKVRSIAWSHFGCIRYENYVILLGGTVDFEGTLSYDIIDNEWFLSPFKPYALNFNTNNYQFVIDKQHEYIAHIFSNSLKHREINLNFLIKGWHEFVIKFWIKDYNFYCPKDILSVISKFYTNE